MAFDQVITLILGPRFIRAFQELGFKNWILENAFKVIPTGENNVARWD